LPAASTALPSTGVPLWFWLIFKGKKTNFGKKKGGLERIFEPEKEEKLTFWGQKWQR